MTRLRPAEAATEVVESAYDPLRLALLFRHFPIGARLTYFPEYRREVKLNTLVLGYRLNDHAIFAREAIELDAEDQLQGFRIGPRKVLPVAELQTIFMLLPDTSVQAKKQLDYVTRASLGRDGQMRRGTALTLQAPSLGRGIPSIDTNIDRLETLEDGPFSGQDTILVEPDLASLKVVDNRRKPRVATAIPAELLVGHEITGTLIACTMADFADDTLRLQPATGKFDPLKVNTAAVVQFSVGPAAQRFRLRGKVMRASEQAIVIRFGELAVGGTYRKADSFDILEIKSGLLNSGG